MSPHTSTSLSCDSSPLRACFPPFEQTGLILDDFEREKPEKLPLTIGDSEDEEQVDGLVSTTKRLRSPHKRLFGENGWLGRTPSMGEPPNRKHKKPGLKTFGERVKQHVEDLVRLSFRSIF